MATLGAGDSNINIDGGVSELIDFGGNDTYTILGSLRGDVEIVDNQTSTINLPEGLTISDAAFLSDGVRFTVNGNLLTLLGEPSLFSFVFGGTPLDPTAGTSQTFAETASAFGTTVPAPGAAINTATITGDVNADGSVGDGTVPPAEPEESFTLTADAASVDEGEVAGFTLTTTNVDEGTELGYTLSGVDAADVTGDLTGTAIVGADGTATISVDLAADETTEGEETLIVALDNGEATADVTVNDTSLTPEFELTADAASVDEGGVATFSLATTNVDAGTELAYTITGVEAADIEGALSGSVTVGTDGTADIALQVVADQLTEGPETLTLSLDNGQAEASTVIQDTSVADPGSYVSGLGGNGVTSAFNIEVVFVSVVSADQRDAFEVAADYLSSLITGDLPDEGAIDDIRITTLLEPIDGAFGVVGSAGPDAVRSGSLLPYEGGMRFDTADVDLQLADGSFAGTVAHEMLHVLGFGTIWEDTELGLLTGTTDLRFTGDNAIAAYNAEFPGIAGSDANSALGVPVETDFGPGTARSHWDEDIFTNELMTGIGMAGTADYTSGMTVASLEDMGYDTIFDVGLPGAPMPQLDDFVMA